MSSFPEFSARIARGACGIICGIICGIELASIFTATMIEHGPRFHHGLGLIVAGMGIWSGVSDMARTIRDDLAEPPKRYGAPLWEWTPFKFPWE